MKFVREYKERKDRRRNHYVAYIKTYDKLEMMVTSEHVVFLGFSRYTRDVQTLYRELLDYGEAFVKSVEELTWLDWLFDRSEIHQQMVVCKYRDTRMKQVMFSNEELTRGKFKHGR